MWWYMSKRRTTSIVYHCGMWTSTTGHPHTVRIMPMVNHRTRTSHPHTVRIMPSVDHRLWSSIHSSVVYSIVYNSRVIVGSTSVQGIAQSLSGLVGITYRYPIDRRSHEVSSIKWTMIFIIEDGFSINDVHVSVREILSSILPSVTTIGNMNVCGLLRHVIQILVLQIIYVNNYKIESKWGLNMI